MNIKNQQIVTEEEIKRNGGTIYDVDSEPLNLPNANLLSDDIIALLEFMNTDEMVLLKQTDKQAFEQTIEDKFPTFALKYYSILQKIINGEDITPLFQMIKVIDTVNIGNKSAEDGEKDVGKYLTKFLPDGLLEKLESGELTEKDIKTKKQKKKKSKF